MNERFLITTLDAYRLLLNMKKDILFNLIINDKNIEISNKIKDDIIYMQHTIDDLQFKLTRIQNSQSADNLVDGVMVPNAG